ncbi:probable E3 ubiquitin-protein ligase XBOS33 isoform X2 [Brachypodium distachyon]|uniref:probable E3 ubiquitin-protein ligase XBOS33 isoform X2 n=1 Tax=Brachypodium distachyon TaxID=15368 RepID=UPI000D0DCA04|nr:probable E3 ubiquitin-protein ligase XBOS33 isoform X2 [Brachypodium distachyon]|eukprot:XP_024317561.1 probable E3 ubiquitin-protein ligase XBOS33 isoform X2 [Brachypodium distachyon]
MGNSLGCSASGERLVSAARDGDAVEARMLLELSPALARYSTFGGLNSPLHFAAAKGHLDIVTMLLEKGADVNARNYCGQTALMHACRHGHWEVVQMLLLFRCNVTRADYLSGRTALHFAAHDGLVRCVRLLLADFVPSSSLEDSASSVADGGDCQTISGSSPNSSLGLKFNEQARARYINKPADGGVTALHMAALNGHLDCMQLLIELGANVSAVTFPYGTTSNLIGAGSTPLHYAAGGGNQECCQLLLAKGASRLTLNCNGWLPLDVARIFGRRSLEPLLSPNSHSIIPVIQPSSYLALPLMSILNIASNDCWLLIRDSMLFKKASKDATIAISFGLLADLAFINMDWTGVRPFVPQSILCKRSCPSPYHGTVPSFFLAMLLPPLLPTTTFSPLA